VFRVSPRGLHDFSTSPLGFVILTECHRYPDDIDFNPRLKKWKCPFCGDTCNCTKCCLKRNVRYTSTANVRIDQDMLLHYAALMANNHNSKNLPLQNSSKLSKKSKSAKKSKSKPARGPVKTKPAVAPPGTTKSILLNSAATRDIESVIRGLADTAAMFENFGCLRGEYWGVVFSNVDGGRIGVAYVGEKLPEIFFLKDGDDSGQADEPSPMELSQGSLPEE